MYVTSFSVFHTKATVSIGLKNIFRIRCPCWEAERVKSSFISSQHKQGRKYFLIIKNFSKSFIFFWKNITFIKFCRHNLLLRVAIRLWMFIVFKIRCYLYRSTNGIKYYICTIKIPQVKNSTILVFEWNFSNEKLC